MKQEERKEQIALIKWARLHSDPRVRMLFHIPNGGKRDIVTASFMKKMGVLAGVPDLFLPAKSGGKKYCGLFIEMKSSSGKLSKKQEEVKSYLEQSGYIYHVCKNWIDAKNSIQLYLL
jgi:hypothetical protein